MASIPAESLRISQTRFAAIDFESAGARPGAPDVPVQIGWGFLEQGEIDPSAFRRFYLRTDQAVTWAAAAVHGISTEDLVDAEPFEHYWPEIKRELSNCVLVAHGHGTEKRYLQRFPNHGLGPWVDTLTLGRRWCSGLTSHSLSDVAQGLGLEAELRYLCPDLDWHDALFDAVACLVILREFIRSGNLEDRSLDWLLREARGD